MQKEQGPRQKRRLWVWVTAGLGSVFLLAMLAALFFVRPFSQGPESISQGPTEQAPSPVQPAKKGVTIFLVLGADKRPGDQGRADTMIVGAYDEGAERLAMVSIPRDTFTYVKGHDFTKINHAFAYGGTRLTLSTVQQLIGLPIDHYVLVNFQGFMRFIDALGGVEIDAEKRMYYVDPGDLGMGPDGLVIDIYPGPQRMDGYKTLAYARFRKDAEGDYGRMRRQQQVITAVVKELIQPATFAKLPKLIPTVFNTLETDLTMAEMISYGLSGKGALEKGITAASTTGADMTLDGIYYLVPNLVDLRTLVYRTLMGKEPPAEFLVRAEEDQDRYARAVREAESMGDYDPHPYGGETGAELEVPAQRRSDLPVETSSRRAGARKRRREFSAHQGQSPALSAPN